jgi:hypothetical protein
MMFTMSVLSILASLGNLLHIKCRELPSNQRRMVFRHNHALNCSQRPLPKEYSLLFVDPRLGISMTMANPSGTSVFPRRGRTAALNRFQAKMSLRFSELYGRCMARDACGLAAVSLLWQNTIRDILRLT